MVATNRPPMIAKAIGPQNTVGAIGMNPRTVEIAVSMSLLSTEGLDESWIVFRQTIDQCLRHQVRRQSNIICLSRNCRHNPIFAPNVSRAGKQIVAILVKDTSGHEARELRTCTQHNAQLAFWHTVTYRNGV